MKVPNVEMSTMILLKGVEELLDGDIRFRSYNCWCSSDPEVQENVPWHSTLAALRAALAD